MVNLIIFLPVRKCGTRTIFDNLAASAQPRAPPPQPAQNRRVPGAPAAVPHRYRSTPRQSGMTSTPARAKPAWIWGPGWDAVGYPGRVGGSDHPANRVIGTDRHPLANLGSPWDDLR